jgi:hypothetical protein
VYTTGPVRVSAAYWAIVATMILASWVAAAVPRRWPRAGAVLLLAATFLVPAIAFYGSTYTTYPSVPGGYGMALGLLIGVWLVGLAPMPLLAAAAATLYLLSWWRSRTSGRPEDSVEQGA